MKKDIKPFTLDEFIKDNPRYYNTFELDTLYNERKVLIGPMLKRVFIPQEFEEGRLNYLGLKAKVRKSQSQTLIVGGVPSNVSYVEHSKIKVITNNKEIRDVSSFVGTYECGLLYLDKPLKIKRGEYITVYFV